MSKENLQYSVPSETLPSLHISSHLEDLGEFVAILRERGIETNNTRIERYVRYLAQILSNGIESVDPSRIFRNSTDDRFQNPGDWFLYILRETHELMWILAGLKSHVPCGIDSKLKLIVGGRDFAALDSDSVSRNTQFELRIASYFCQSGCDVDLSSGTDVIATTRDHAFFVECKRVAAANQLAKRLSEARGQLLQRMPRKDGRRLVLGCVAADVTKIAFSHNGLTWGVTNEHSRDIAREKLHEVAEAADRHLTFGSPRKLLCYWLQIHIASLIMRPVPNPATRFSSYFVPKEQFSRKENRTFAKFFGLFEAASRADDRSRAPQVFVPRTTFTFPAGTVFRVEEDLLLALMEQTQLSDAEQESIIASVRIDGDEQCFSFSEASLFAEDALSEWQASRADLGYANMTLVARLYAQRNRFGAVPEDEA
jgi:hypothetical protein